VTEAASEAAWAQAAGLELAEALAEHPVNLESEPASELESAAAVGPEALAQAEAQALHPLESEILTRKSSS